MAVLALGVAGAALGGTVGWASAGWIVGTMLGQFLFAQKKPNILQEGPRLNDTRVQASTWGTSIPIVYADFRTAGNVIWCPGLVETSTEATQGGGKGMGGGGGVTTITYTVSASMAIAICRGPIVGIRKVWANGKLIYDVGSGASVETIIASNTNAQGMRIYLGDETQLPDPTMEATQGAGNVPAHRGIAYVVFPNFNLEPYGKSVPNFTFEAIAAGTVAVLQLPATWTGSLGGGGTADSRYNNAATIFTIGNGVTMWSAISATPIGSFSFTAAPFLGFTIGGFEISAFSAGPSGDMFHGGRATVNGTLYGIVAQTSENCSPKHIWWAGPESNFSLNRGQMGYNFSDGWIYYAETNTDIIYGFNTSAPDIVNAAAPVTSHRVTIASGISGTAILGTGRFNQSSTSVTFFGRDASNNAYLCFPRNGVLNARPLGVTVALCNVAFTPVFDHLGNPWIAVQPTTPSPHAELWQIDPDTGATVRSIVLDNGVVVTNMFFSLDGYLYTYEGNNIFRKRDYLTGTLLYNSVTQANVSNIYPTPWGNVVQITDGGATQIAMQILEPLPRMTVTASTTVADALTDLCGLAGLESGDIDVTAASDTLYGYIVARSGTARAAVEPLLKAFFLDAVEADGKLKFIKRTGSSVIDIPFDNLLTTEGADPLQMTRLQEMELPREIALSFINKDGDYLLATEYARRLVTESDSYVVEELPIAFAPAQAAQIVESWLYDAHTQRNQIRFSTDRRYAEYMPTDVVTVEGIDANYDVHLRKKTDAGIRIDWEGVAADAPVYTSSAPGASDQETAPGVDLPGPARFEPLDIPILRDSDDNAGFYAALSGYTDTFRGAVLYGSPDGITFTELGSVMNGAVLGYATTALSTYTGGNAFDERNSVTVTLDYGEISSTTRADVLNGGNVAVLGNEILQFRDATLVTETTYTLTGLLRGRKGTDMTGHAIGDRFVLMQSAGLLRPILSLVELNVDRYYRAQAFGEALGSSPSRAFECIGAGLMPLAPCNLRAFRHQPSTNDWTIKWVRRGRVSSEWLPSVDVPIGETTESYSVDILNTSSGAVVRTLALVSSPTATYTSADQVTDFGSSQTTIRCKVYQISASVGRGFPVEGTF